MQPFSIVVAQSDCVAAEHLAATLHRYFRLVAVARDIDEMRRSILHHRAHVAIIDLELVDFPELREICHEFDQVAVVCTHRVPDEQMWTESLASGAADCCEINDVKGIVTAASRSAGESYAHAA
ncbi:MAG TPA: hypothetical protein VN622_14715 [Clostridia bacterium]|nr:hypothetical protein [Clostridia bacterium]